MKVHPKQVELTEEDIKRAISYYLTRLGYGEEKKIDMQPIPSDEFEVELKVGLINYKEEAFSAKATLKNNNF